MSELRTSMYKSNPTKAAFDWADPFQLDSQLTEDERQVRDTARGYAQDKLMPRVTAAYREEKFGRAIMTEWADSACSARPFRMNMVAQD